MISCARVYWMCHLLAELLFPGCVLLLSKRNLITQYPVIFIFRVRTGQLLEKELATGRVPGSRRALININIVIIAISAIISMDMVQAGCLFDY